MALDNLTIFQTSKIFFSKCLLKLRMRYLVMCEPQVFGLRADLSLPFFEILGFGRVWVVQNLLRTGGQAGIYVYTRT